MFFYSKLQDFEISNVQFMKVKCNIVMDDGFFVKMIYSDENILMNGIYLEFPLQITCKNKNFYFFQNHSVITDLLEIERSILTYYKIYKHNDKLPIYLLKSQLEKNFFKLNSNDNNNNHTNTTKKIILKLSGVWENKMNVGINYKFYEV